MKFEHSAAHRAAIAQRPLAAGAAAANGTPAAPWPGSACDEPDALAQMALADAADASLMRLVLCAASATLALALLSSLV